MIKKTNIDGLLIVEGGQTFSDDRGFFREPFRRDEFERVLGKPWVHVQENHAYSKKDVLRGIHVAPWDKFIYVPYGEVLSVIVDLRRDTSSFKQIFKMQIGFSNEVKLFIPAGLGNSYLILSEEAVYEYQVNQYFQSGAEKGVAWNDPELGIDWPIANPILSEKDQNNLSLKEYLGNF
ncbi:dTDP-4-dehydrorhamnose 3,5-epimerase family protein [Candidatus Daviesbacteria bacterium]|nr:dTDP-4-dehydrorhamnose 3,5-epimerase family protein [Candidatus Daviesbacteria bacterium]